MNKGYIENILINILFCIILQYFDTNWKFRKKKLFNILCYIMNSGYFKQGFKKRNILECVT